MKSYIKYRSEKLNGREEKKMFLRMIKNSLKRKRLMNITLLIFIVISAIIVCTGVSEIYYATVGLSHIYEMTNTADYTIMRKQAARTVDEVNAKIEEWANLAEYITEYNHEKMILLNYKQLDFEGLDEENEMGFTAGRHYLGVQPKGHNKVYDLSDQPFTLKSGEIAIGSTWQEATHTKVGDIINVTTDMGNTYSFRVAYIFKDVLFPIGSLNQSKRYFIAESDFKKLLSESPIPVEVYTFSATDKSAVVPTFKEHSEYDVCIVKEDITESFMVQSIMGIVLVSASIFLMIIILLTLNFTIKASLIEDEKEIGMMRAIGLPAFQFKGLYIASYLFLTVIGSLLGLIIGLPISHYVTNYFAYNLIPPNEAITYTCAIAAVIGMSIFIILFCFIAVRKIDKVSVAVALNQGVQGERQVKNSKKSFYKRKKMGVPTFLAVTDIACGFRQYLFLMCAYLLGAMILLFPQHILNTMESPSYMKYWGYLPSDFRIFYLSEDLQTAYENALVGGERVNQLKMFSWVEETAAKNNVDIDIDVAKYAYYNCFIDDQTSMEVECIFGDTDTKEFEYTKGNAPEYENEIAVGDNFAKRYGLKIGSSIWIEVEDYNEDRTATVKEKREFFITGTYQIMSNNGMCIRMGNAFNSTAIDHGEPVRLTINAPEQDKPTIIEQLKQIFGDKIIYTEDEYLQTNIADFIGLFKGIIIFLDITIVSILFLMTLLYTKIIMAREIASLALLKQIGFMESELKKWQLIRIGLLTSGAIILGIIGSVVLGQPIASYSFQKLSNVTEYKLVIDRVATCIVTPLIIFTTVFIATLLTCRRINTLKLYDMNRN